MTTKPLSAIAEELAQATGGFTGGPRKHFEEIGRHTFITLLQHGLLPGSKVLDYGCGALRLGYWIMRFLEPGCYYGIEPDGTRLTAGKEITIGPELMALKQPTFSECGDFDLSVFGVKFDFIVARSIFTHFSPAAIKKVLSTVPAALEPKGAFFASYWPDKQDELGGDWNKTIGVKNLLAGETLGGRPAESHIKVSYSARTLIQFARDCGLSAKRLEQPITGRQPWIRFSLEEVQQRAE